MHLCLISWPCFSSADVATLILWFTRAGFCFFNCTLIDNPPFGCTVWALSGVMAPFSARPC